MPTSHWLRGEPSSWSNATHVSERSTNIGASRGQLHQPDSGQVEGISLLWNNTQNLRPTHTTLNTIQSDFIVTVTVATICHQL